MNDYDGPDIFEPEQSHDALQPTTSTGTTEHEQPPQLNAITLEDQNPESKYRRVIEKRTKQRDDYKNRYRAAATQLTKYKLSDGGFPQLDDSYLIGRVEILRDKIWRFGLRHYEEGKGFNPSGREILPGRVFVKHTKHNLHPDITPQRALESAKWCPMIIETFMWDYLVSEVFNQFCWAGKNGNHMGDVYRIMKRNQSTAAELQSFQTWSATTTKLIRESMGRGESGWTGSYRKLLNDLMNDAYVAIQPHLVAEPGEMKKEIREILQTAIELDEELSQLLAHFNWEFPRLGEEFDEERMKLAEKEELHSTKSINIIICPGITKRGQSGNFDKVDWLVPIKVSCSTPIAVTPSIRHQLREGKSKLEQSVNKCITG
ncbi:hypothetical protein N7516_000389 [Penicillium verrucosum]|uniref:uncharacterized protein n=1 Tax=Penicillium verrucosum TaxID=60171 RepID=UPI002545A149|nr:uncharacterized protein N7516_000389 [Penicillium verrucosum]KAJ5940221.1 hypothetical protein N7516_000389 [Penicillium verrucosum]